MQRVRDYRGMLDLAAEDHARLRLLGEVGTLYLYLGHAEAARDVFRAVTIVAPDEPTGFLGLADAELMAGRYGTALAAADAALRCAYVDPAKTAMACNLRAAALERLGRDADAHAARRQAAALGPLATPLATPPAAPPFIGLP